MKDIEKNIKKEIKVNLQNVKTLFSGYSDIFPQNNKTQIMLVWFLKKKKKNYFNLVKKPTERGLSNLYKTLREIKKKGTKNSCRQIRIPVFKGY